MLALSVETELELMVAIKKSVNALVVAPIIACASGVVSPASGDWCGFCPRDGEWRLQAHVSTYVENPQVFRSELRPKLSYAIRYTCVRIVARRAHDRKLRDQ